MGRDLVSIQVEPQPLLRALLLRLYSIGQGGQRLTTTVPEAPCILLGVGLVGLLAQSAQGHVLLLTTQPRDTGAHPQGLITAWHVRLIAACDLRFGETATR